MKNSKQFLIPFVFALVLAFTSCQAPAGDQTGSEYMPDMAHSIAYEANVYNYYYNNTWDSASVLKLKELSNPRLPVAGTVPRGYAGVDLANSQSDRAEAMRVLQGANSLNAIATPVNGHVPYYYEDTEEERLRAGREIIDNPFPITADGLERGEELYVTFCAVCHGEKGDGNGWLVDEANPNAVYPAAPANFLLPIYADSTNGKYYHALIYGKNVMGGYADKISYEERWQVIHYIRSLQAKEQGLEYSPTANTYNASFGTPESEIEPIASFTPTETSHPENEVDHHEDDHDDDGHGGGDHSSDDHGHDGHR